MATKRETTCTPHTLAEKASAWMKSLSGLRGVERPLPSGKAALVVIDAQRLFCSPESPAYLPAWEAVQPQVESLLRAFQTRRLPIVFTLHGHEQPDDSCLEKHFFGRVLRTDDPLADLIPAFHSTMQTNTLWQKSGHAAFAQGLCPVLEEASVLVLVGVQTPLCVLSTALDLARIPKIPLIVADACAATTEDLHLAALRVAASGHAHVRTTEQVMAWLGELEGGR